MKISEVNLSVVKRYGNIEISDDDSLIEDVLMPSALSRISDYTGLSVDELDSHESLTVAYVAMCVFLYDNRSMNIVNDKQNAVLQSFMDAHCRNLL